MPRSWPLICCLVGLVFYFQGKSKNTIMFSEAGAKMRWTDWRSLLFRIIWLYCKYFYYGLGSGCEPMWSKGPPRYDIRIRIFHRYCGCLFFGYIVHSLETRYVAAILSIMRLWASYDQLLTRTLGVSVPSHGWWSKPGSAAPIWVSPKRRVFIPGLGRYLWRCLHVWRIRCCWPVCCFDSYLYLDDWCLGVVLISILSNTVARIDSVGLFAVIWGMVELTAYFRTWLRR